MLWLARWDLLHSKCVRRASMFGKHARQPAHVRSGNCMRGHVARKARRSHIRRRLVEVVCLVGIAKVCGCFETLWRYQSFTNNLARAQAIVCVCVWADGNGKCDRHQMQPIIDLFGATWSFPFCLPNVLHLDSIHILYCHSTNYKLHQ